MHEPSPLKTFCCYAHEDRSAVEGLRKHLNLLEKKQMLQIWEDGKILPGEEWDKSIKRQLEVADLVLLFVSVDFINSDYIETTELQAALARHRAGEAVLVPVIVRSCDWTDYFDMGKFQALPKQARPIQSAHFPIADEAYHEVAQGIKALAQGLLEKRRAAADAHHQVAAEKNRADRQRQRDQTAWETAHAEAKRATTVAEKISAYEVYLEDLAHTLHRAEAEKQVADLTSAETKRKIEEKKKAEAKRAAEAAEQERKKPFSLFPLHGVTLGKTTIAELRRLGEHGTLINPNTGRPYEFYKLKGVDFWYGKGLADHIYLVTGLDPMPDLWKQAGFDWGLSYNEWLALFSRLGYETKVHKKPIVITYQGKPSFSADLHAHYTQDGIRYTLRLDFDYSQLTKETDKNTLYSLNVDVG